MKSKKRIHNSLFFSGVSLTIFGAIGILVGLLAANGKVAWGGHILSSSAIGFFIGMAMIIIIDRLFQKVRKGTVLFSDDYVELIDEHGFFLKSDLQRFDMFMLPDITNNVTMSLKYFVGNLIMTMNYTVSYEAGHDTDSLKLLVKFKKGNTRNELKYVLSDFVVGLLYEFEKINSSNFISGAFYNDRDPAQQTKFAEMVKTALVPEVRKAGLRLKEVKFWLK